jgi:hypothetical protein
MTTCPFVPTVAVPYSFLSFIMCFLMPSTQLIQSFIVRQV